MKQINITDYLKTKTNVYQNTIKNTNGNTYRVLQQKQKYMLLECIDHTGRGFDRYIVCWNYNSKLQTWQHGNYFNTLDEAMEYYQSIE